MLITALAAFVILQLYTVTLILLRGNLFNTRVYRPMLWNLFLSLVPLLVQLVVAILLVVLAAIINSMAGVPTVFIRIFQGIGIVGLIVWALFFPNATYLITELNFSHRKKNDKVPEYYDIVMTFTLAVTGIINALVSLTFFHFIILIILDPAKGTIPLASWMIVFAYAFASSFAIYMGRSIRVNSWDIVHPIQFASRLFRHFKDPAHRRTALGYTIFFSGILIIAHVMYFNLVYAAIIGT